MPDLFRHQSADWDNQHVRSNGRFVCTQPGLGGGGKTNTTDSELTDVEAGAGYLGVLWIDLLTFRCLRFFPVKVPAAGRQGSPIVRATPDRVRLSPGSSSGSPASLRVPQFFQLQKEDVPSPNLLSSAAPAGEAVGQVASPG